MSGYPRYDITKSAVDPRGMTDTEFKGIISDLEADIKDARGMTYPLTEDIKRRRGLLKVYKSFWKLREQARIRKGYSRRYEKKGWGSTWDWILTPGPYYSGKNRRETMSINPPYTTIDKNSQDKIPKGPYSDYYKDAPERELTQLTFDSTGKLVEAWDPSAGPEGGTWDPRKGEPDANRMEAEGKEPENFQDRNHPFRQPVKQGGYTKYYYEHRNFFAEGGDAWEALTKSPDMQIVIDEKGFMVDSWDSETKKRYDTLGGGIGSRDTPFTMPPDKKAVKDMTKAELEAAIKEHGVDIAKESGTIAYDKYAARYKKGRMSELMRAYEKASQPTEPKYQPRPVPTEQGYRRRYPTPRPYAYSPMAYYRGARNTFVLSPAITEGYIFKTFGWASGGSGIPRD